MARYSSGRGQKPSGGFELRAWYFMRISGLLLVFLALGHLFIMHIQNNVETVNYAFVADRWSTPTSGYFWRIYDLLLISLAVLHGFNGLRQVLDEYITRRGWRVFAHTVIWSGMTLILLMGTYAIMMFEPDRKYIENWKAERAGQVQAAAALPDR